MTQLQKAGHMRNLLWLLRMAWTSHIKLTFAIPKPSLHRSRLLSAVASQVLLIEGEDPVSRQHVSHLTVQGGIT